jgi:hypothetical protein
MGEFFVGIAYHIVQYFTSTINIVKERTDPTGISPFQC